jgi:hypothetical protein
MFESARGLGGLAGAAGAGHWQATKHTILLCSSRNPAGIPGKTPGRAPLSPVKGRQLRLQPGNSPVQESNFRQIAATSREFPQSQDQMYHQIPKSTVLQTNIHEQTTLQRRVEQGDSELGRGLSREMPLNGEVRRQKARKPR